MHSDGAATKNETALVVTLERRLPQGLILLSSPSRDHVHTLDPAERHSIERSVAIRRNEFSTGRWLARQALAKLGMPTVSVPVGPNREPVWPNGIVGSVTHSGGICAAVLGLATQYSGVGLDLELSDRPFTDLADFIVSPREPAVYRSPRLLRLIFSAKEAVFKCLYPIHYRWLDFHDIDIRVDLESRCFTADCGKRSVNRSLVARGHGLLESTAEGVATLFAIPG